MTLGTAVIPMEHSDEDGAKALLLFRRKLRRRRPGIAFQSNVCSADARDLLGRVAAHHT